MVAAKAAWFATMLVMNKPHEEDRLLPNVDHAGQGISLDLRVVEQRLALQLEDRCGVLDALIMG